LGAAHLPSAMLAGDEAALAVAGVAVGVAGRLAEHADRSGLLFPFEDAIVGDVAPQQKAAIAEPHRPLAPAAPGIELLDRGVERRADLLEARVKSDHRGVRIWHAGLPIGGHLSLP